VSDTGNAAELLPGYYRGTDGAWLTLPWPNDLADLPPSLGPQCVAWGHAYLLDHLTGLGWEYTLSQRKWLHLWYAVRPDGRWLYRRGVRRGAKGTGKDPLIAAMALTEACGPVVFDGWDAAGRPVGRHHRMSLVQIGANSEGQGTDVLRVANGMISADLANEERADPGILRTLFVGGGRRIEVLTNSESSAEGDPATAVFLNETHHMTPSSGRHRIAKVARRNAAKSPAGRARVAEFTNAHLPGEGSVGEESFDAWQKQVSGQAARTDILYDSREAAPHLQLHIEAERRLGIAQAYADSPWTDQERIEDEALDPDTAPADSVRFYFNALPTNETAWVNPRAWDARATAGALEPTTALAMFLDCSKSTDATTLAVCRLSDGAVYGLGGWQKPHGDRGTGWLAPREEVDAAVRFAFETYDVQWFGVDPSPARDDDTEALYWAEQIDAWHRDLRGEVLLWATPGVNGSAVLFDMRKSVPGANDRLRMFTEMAELTAAAIDDPTGDLAHDGDPMMRIHVHNARRRPNQWGVGIGKSSRSSSRLVDYAVTMVGARTGRRIVLNSGKSREKKKRTGVVV
jgi:hypothetical protein